MVERLQLSGSPWVVETWMTACGFGISGPLEIRAVNAISKEVITLAVIDDPANTKLSVDRSNNLVVTLPNLVYITGAKTEFGGVRVIYNYQPKDDPEARAKWQLFVRNPRDPAAKQWYCENIAAKMDLANRDAWSKIIGCLR